jgi:hypothetical protein
MYNHCRTLLLNRAAVDPDAYPGEELVPQEFREIRLPSYLTNVRARLFGADPDRTMLNYRLKQFLPLLHQTELAPFVTDLDPRITYDVADEHDLVLPAMFQPSVTQVSGSGAALLLSGNPAAPDMGGQLHYQFNAHVLLAEGDIDTVRIDRVIPVPARLWIWPLSLTDGASACYDLAETGYKVALTTTDPAAGYIVEGYRRPQWSLGQIVALARGLGEPDLDALFGIQPAEPWATFRNLWYDHPELAYKLGGLLLALAYRTEEVRNGRN